jgi:hypothetical protein
MNKALGVKELVGIGLVLLLLTGLTSSPILLVGAIICFVMAPFSRKKKVKKSSEKPNSRNWGDLE